MKKKLRRIIHVERRAKSDQMHLIEEREKQGERERSKRTNNIRQRIDGDVWLFIKRRKWNFFLSVSLFNCSQRKYVRMCRLIAITACLSVKQSLHEGANYYIKLIHFISLFLSFMLPLILVFYYSINYPFYYI
jgi:hypothetical protein